MSSSETKIKMKDIFNIITVTGLLIFTSFLVPAVIGYSWSKASGIHRIDNPIKEVTGGAIISAPIVVAGIMLGIILKLRKRNRPN